MRLTFFLIIFGLSPCYAFERTIEGKVSAVINGNTITITTHRKKAKKVCLYQIAPPVENQPWGRKSTQALSNKVFGKIIRVNIEKTAGDGCLVGTLWFAGENINRSLVLDGHARFSRNDEK
jgi:endonuclease YncB( thermonuclease family)